MKKSHIIGGIAVLSILGYFFMRKKEEDNFQGIKGLDININPHTLFESSVDLMVKNPIKNHLIKTGVKHAINGYKKVRDEN